MILSQTDKNLVKLELDLGWVATAKQDPVALFKGNPAFENAKLAGMKY